MKKISLVLVGLFVVLGFSGSALAVGAPLNTGTLLGTYSINNDKEIDVERQLTGVDLTFSHKYESKDVTSGTSKLSQSADYYTVKASNSFALYEIAGGAFSVNWANETIKNKNDKLQNVSHVTFWTITDKKSSTAVPIPASVFLFGSGLLGVLGLVRSKKKQSH